MNGIKDNVSSMLQLFNENVGEINEEVLANTPDRVSRMYQELLSGYECDPKQLLSRLFDSDDREMVIISGIKFASLCEHHMIPFIGEAHIGYIPNGKLVGLSKFARLVECFSRRLQLQERIASNIADTLMEHVAPEGVGVVLVAEHMCMSIRGIKKPGAKTICSAVRGKLSSDAKAREEFLRLIRLNGGFHD